MSKEKNRVDARERAVRRRKRKTGRAGGLLDTREVLLPCGFAFAVFRVAVLSVGGKGKRSKKAREGTCENEINTKRILLSSGGRNLEVATGCLRNRQNV